MIPIVQLILIHSSENSDWRSSGMAFDDEAFNIEGAKVKAELFGCLNFG